MIIPKNITKIALKATFKPELHGLLVNDDIITATDSFKAIRINTGVKTGIHAIVSIDGINARDVLSNPSNVITVTHKDGSTFMPKTLPAETYPNVDTIIDAATKETNVHIITLDRQYLIDLLEAIPKSLKGFDHVTLSIPLSATYKPVLITTKDKMAQALIMPVAN